MGHVNRRRKAFWLGFLRVNVSSAEKFRHPLFHSNTFVLKCLLSASLVLIAAISFKGQAGPFQQLKPMISQTFEQDFQFAAANRWFEKTVGNPLAF